jgi:hypothetical protein
MSATLAETTYSAFLDFLKNDEGLDLAALPEKIERKRAIMHKVCFATVRKEVEKELRGSSRAVQVDMRVLRMRIEADAKARSGGIEPPPASEQSWFKSFFKS